ncbi:MAG: glycosyltransferase family 2 protein [Bacteroidales bacterium]|nr:glycosyltransferase family 2 protein [Bacteroidales bacterium]
MLISIIVPVYNSGEYLKRCLESCLSQSFTDFELIVVDDGSTDNSYEIASDIAERDSRLHLYHQDNSGASVARNKGLDVATGDYVMFVDSDDWIEPEMLSEMFKIIDRHRNIQVVQTAVPGDFRKQEREGVYSRKEAVKALLEGSWWGSVCKLVRRDAVDVLRFPSKTISEDYLFNYCLFSKINALYYSYKTYYHRTIRQDSLSRSKLSNRKFDEYYNVGQVCELVTKEYPDYLPLADSHLAGTCLKLLFLVFEDRAESSFPGELSDLIDCIRSKYFSFIRNPHIPLAERFLLALCFSKRTAKLAERAYHSFK